VPASLDPLPAPQADSHPATPQLNQSTIPPSVSQGYVYLHQPPRGLQPSWHDPNVLDVVNPRRWGQGQVAPVSEEALVSRQVGGENTEQAWAAEETLAEWRQQVSQAQPSSQSDDVSESDSNIIPNESEEGPDRPNSIPPPQPAVTAYISSESSAASTPRPSEVELDREATPPLVRDTPSPTEVEENLPTPRPTPTGPTGRRPSISRVEANGQVLTSPPRSPRHPRPTRRSGPGSGASWWKREAHPAYSAEYEARRILVM